MTWAERAQRCIVKVHAEMPGCTAEVLRKALRRASGEFTGGTSWGAKIWPRECRRYLAAQFGQAGTDPIQKIDRPDIHFPFRETRGE